MELKYDKIQTTGTDTPLKIVKGHFATNHAHTNYYFDLTTVKRCAVSAYLNMCVSTDTGR